MKKFIGFIIIIALFILFAIGFVSTDYSDTGELNQNVSDCGILNTTNAVYTLNMSVNSNSTCFNITANNITLDCGGYIINYSTNGTLGYGVYSNQDNTIVRDCVIKQENETTRYKHAIYFNGVDNGTIYNNTISSPQGASSASLIYLDSSDYNNISNNNLTAKDANSVVIYLKSSDYNSVGFNFINRAYNLFNNEIYGIYSSYSDGNFIFNNNISGNAYDDLGIYIYRSDNHRIYNNTIASTFGNAYNLYIRESTNTTLRGNILNGLNSTLRILATTVQDTLQDIDTSNYAHGLPILYNKSIENINVMNNSINEYSMMICANCTNISYDNIIMNGSGKGGIWLYYSENSTITNSDLESSLIESDTINLYRSSGCTIFNNTITNNNPFASGIYLDYSDFCNVSLNNLSLLHGLHNWYNYGIYLTNSHNNLFANNFIKGYAVNTQGYYLTASSSNMMYNERLDMYNSASTKAINLLSSSNNNTFYHANISTPFDQLTNSVDVYSTSTGRNYLVNSTFNKSDVYVSEGSLDVRYYLGAYTHDGSNPLNGYNVSVYNVSGDLVETKLTQTNGYTESFVLTEYVQNGSGVYSDSNNNFSFQSPYTVNVTTNYSQLSNSSNLSLSEIISFRVDTISPNASLNSPQNNSYLNSPSINFTANLSDDYSGIENATLFVYNQSGLYNQTTVNYPTNPISAVVGVVVNLVEGVYTWFWSLFDWAGNEGLSENRTLTVDFTPGQIVLSSPQNSFNSTVIGFRNLSVNLSDIYGLGNATLIVYNITGLYNSTTVSFSEGTTSTNLGINVNLSEGFYYWSYSIKDIATNQNNSENRTITIDNTAPIITQNFPVLDSIYGYEPTSLNFSSSDAVSGLKECWYVINGSSSVPGTCNLLYSISNDLVDEGNNSWLLYAKDNLDNVQVSSLNFTVFTTAPQINFSNPTIASGNYSSSSITINISASSVYLTNITIYIYNSTELYSSITNSTYSSLYTNPILAEDTYYINASACDIVNACNFTETRVIRLDRTKPLIEFGDNTLVNNANTSLRNIYVNVSVTDLYEKNITFTLRNSSGLIVNSTTYSAFNRTINWSIGYDDSFNYSVSVADYSNNINSTSVRTVNIDTIGPAFSSISSITGSNSAELSVIIGDLPSGVSSAWIQLFDANDTYLNNFSMSISSGNVFSGTYNTTLTGLTEGRDYLAVIFSNDTGNAITNTTHNFDLYPVVNFSVEVSYDSSSFDLDFNFDRAGTSQNLISNSTSLENYSFDVKKRIYDFNLSFANNTIIFRSLNITGNASMKIQNIEDGNNTNISLYKVLDIVAVDLINFSLLSNAEIRLDYSGKFGSLFYPAISESELTIHKCADWNFSSFSCLGAWSLVSSSYVDTTNDDVLVNVSSFSGYAITEYRCGNGICEANYGETESSCNADCGVPVTVPPSSGGGGGGGGSDSNNPLSFSTLPIEKAVMVGTKDKVEIVITNTKSTVAVVQLSVEGEVDSITDVENARIEIPGSNSGLAVFNIEGLKEGAYKGYFVINYGNVLTKIPSTILITSKNDKLLDLSLNLLDKRINPGEDLNFNIVAFNLGKLNRYDLHFSYEILNSKTNESIYLNQEAIAIETSLNLQRSIKIPSNINSGKYLLVVKANYDTLGATAIGEFSVYKSLTIPLPEFLRENIPIFISLLFIIIVSVIAYYYYTFIRKKLFEKEMAELKKKSPYPFPDFATLPKSKFAYIGMVADAKVKTYLDYTQLNRHTLIAGGTGSGKTISGMVLAEELIKRGSSVIVFDPVGQWTGFAKKNTEKGMVSKFRTFGMGSAKSFSPRIINITKDTMNVDILAYMKKGGLTILKLNNLTPKNADVFIDHCLNRIYRGNLSESSSLKTLLVLDEVHRLLPKYGGRKAYVKLEQAVREFRKWGVGLLMISQVLTDFKGAIRGNIGTEIQMFSRYEGDVKRVRERHGSEVSKLIPKLPVGLGMVEAGGYNKGNPYFVEFRPISHSPLKLTDEEVKSYIDKNPILEKEETEEQKKSRLEQEKEADKKAKELGKKDKKQEKDAEKEESVKEEKESKKDSEKTKHKKVVKNKSVKKPKKK